MTKLFVFTKVKVTIPAKSLKKEYEKHKYISFKLYNKNNKKLNEIEEAMNKLAHIKSLIEKINLRFIP